MGQATIVVVLWLVAALPASEQAAGPSQASPAPATLAMEDAVALALHRNRDVLAAQLGVEAALVEEMAAKVLPNPSFNFALQNLVPGRGNPQGEDLHPAFWQQNVDAVAIGLPLDVWRKRHHRWAVARQSTQGTRWLLLDAIREVAYQTRARFLAVLREQAELALMVETRRGYEQTVLLMRRREAAGDIARTDLDKVELEALRYANLLILAQRELVEAKDTLAEILAFADAQALPDKLEEAGAAPALGPLLPPDGAALLARALNERPDLQAALSARTASVLLGQQARSESFPDVTVGLGYTRSHFTVSGDNPHALSLQVGFDLPVWQRNQAGRQGARVAQRQADNDLFRLRQTIGHEVGRATRAWQSAGRALRLYEQGDESSGPAEPNGQVHEADGMLAQAQRAREVAKRSFAAGATSLLEMLEAERTYLQIRGDHLRTLHAWRQAHVDVAYVTAGTPP